MPAYALNSSLLAISHGLRFCVTILKVVWQSYYYVVESLTESVLERVKKIDRKLDELRMFLEDVFLTPEESVLLDDADRLVKGKKLERLTSLDDV